jgi:hypothetical protein
MNIKLLSTIFVSTFVIAQLTACGGGASGSNGGPLASSNSVLPAVIPTAIPSSVKPTIMTPTMDPTEKPTAKPTPKPTAKPTPKPIVITQTIIPTISEGIISSRGLSAATLLGLGLTNSPQFEGFSTLPSPLPKLTYSNAPPASVIPFNMPGATSLIFTSFIAPKNFIAPAGTGFVGLYSLITPMTNISYNLAFFNGTSWITDATNFDSISPYADTNGTYVSMGIQAITNSFTFISGKTYAVVLYSITTNATPTPVLI